MLKKIFNKFKLARHLKTVQPFLKIGNSHLLNAFRLIITIPVNSKIFLTVGNDSMLDCVVTFESRKGEVNIGDRVFIGNSTLISRNQITIENDVFIAWGVYIYDHNSHSLDYRERVKDQTQQLADYRSGQNFIVNKNWDAVNSSPIKICSHSWIGMNSTILKGVTIGEGAIVAAGSVVTRNVAPWTVVGGNPAVLIKEIPIELRKA